MERLARPLSDLEPHYDAVVVGSGYGGAIAACRLSRAGRSVALLERGREIHPGEYPSSLLEAASEVQMTGAGLGADEQAGDRRNLYWFHADGEMNVFSGCGLGGTSLVNAGVALRPDPRIFDRRWPKPLRRDEGGRMDEQLAKGYAAAESMLRPTTYPHGYPPLPKVEALRLAAGRRSIAYTPVNVTFRSGPNAAGVHQDSCTGCGDCITGCNVGAKNTVLMNYLPDAVAHGASIFTEVEVRTVARGKRRKRWVVHLRPLDTDDDPSSASAVTAGLVVLAAGTLGTTEILLRSQRAGLALSDQLGRHFSGNGDVIGFAARPRTVVRGIGAGHRAPDPVAPAGPCITACIDARSPTSVAQSLLIEDAVIPGAMAEAVATDLATQLGAGRQTLRRRLDAGWGGLVSLLGGGHTGATERLQTLLLMGHDDGEGRIVLEGEDHLRIEWPDVGASPYYQRADQALAAAASRGGGTYVRNPLGALHLGGGLITVHPLGGCAMGTNIKRGVVDHRGRVFSPGKKGAVYPGLLVADGSVVPAPLGVNPLLTIAALAERSLALLCREHGWEHDAPARRPPPPPPGPFPPSATPGLRFTEQMSGWWWPDPTADTGELTPYREGERRGRGDPSSALSFTLTISTDDVRRVSAHLDTPMLAAGTVTAPRLSPDPLRVERGWFRTLVADDPTDASVRHMRYHLPLVATDGSRYVLDGFKVVGPGVLDDAWRATTTLYVTLRRHGAGGAVVGRGVARIGPGGLVRLLRAIRVTGPVGSVERLTLEAAFARAFAGPLVHEYGTVIHRTTRFDPAASPRRHRPLDVPPPQYHEYRTPDGLSLRLTRYKGGKSDPVLLSHGMGNSLTWSLDTVDRTLLETLVAHDYDVWLQDWRSSTLFEASRAQFDGDQVARFDHPGAAAKVAQESGRHDLHVIAHCVGSITWMMATLSGTVDPSSLVCSAVALHPVAPTLTRFKVGLHLGEVLHRAGVRYLTTDSTRAESFWQRQFDRELRLYPIPKEEECDQAVCRRVAFIYGNGVHHANLNPATHAALHELFGITNLTMMDHLSRMARAQQVVSADGRDTYLAHLDRLRRPITFLHGRRNLVWLPASTERTHQLLSSRLDPTDYERVVFDDYGHQDVLNGARSALDTYPAVLAHLKRVNAR